MAFIPVPNTVQAEVRMSLANQQIENVLYFSKAGGFDGSSLDALGIMLRDWWGGQYAYNLSNQISLREIYIIGLNSATDITHTTVPSGTIAGQNPSPALPNNVAFCVSFRTQYRGRSFRGRNYVAGLPEAGVTLSNVEPNYVQQLVSAYNTLITDAANINWEWVVVSRYANKAPRTEGVTSAILSAVAVDSVIDSQRRRLPGRGQ